MKKKYPCMCSGKKYSRRNFITTLAAAGSALLLTPPFKTKNLFASPLHPSQQDLVKVATTVADNYEQNFVKEKVQFLFESLGGISDIIKTSDRVAIKINLTGGSSNAGHSRLQGVDIRESVWTHPEVLRAVTELIIDHGVSADNIYFVEAIWDTASYADFGYQAVQEDLGVQFINLNSEEPYADFMDKEVGDGHFYYETLKFNRILDEVDAFVSIPKMKEHYNAAITHSMKNLVGTVPLQNYTLPGMTSYRSALHYHVQGGDIKTSLPRSICDLNMARPIHLAVIDGIKNAEGGEGPWNATFQPAEYHLLLAGKDPVATDSIAVQQMDSDPEAQKLQTRSGDIVDNYLYLAHQKGMGTNILSEIELVGDGVTAVSPHDISKNNIPETITLFQNYPNPFNSSTIIRYYIPESGRVTLKVYNAIGQMIRTLLNSHMTAGEHQLQWRANDLASGIYFYKLRFNGYSKTRKLVLQK